MRKRFKIEIRGKNYTLGERTWIMGILNVTPDSFSDGGLYFDQAKAVDRGLELAAEGADIIDVGGESTRPGSDFIPVEEELKRVIPVISKLKEKTHAFISIDSNKSQVIKAALDEGAEIVNDISSFRFDSKIVSIVAERNVPLVLMHMKGAPKTMQINPVYENLLQEINSFLEERINKAVKNGVKREQIIIDPGIGFGKTWRDNLRIINELQFLEILDRPILIGPSRKSFIGQVLEEPEDKRLEGTIVSSIIALERGAHIVRVHDVAEVKKAVVMAESILSFNSVNTP
ncbi:MAG: dihydropteroate synthase [Candidatus Aminicenantia bacterium]